MEELHRIGPKLRRARQDRDLTLAALAHRVGMSTSTLSRLESGRRQATLELLLPLTRYLGLSIDELLREESPDPRVRRSSFIRNGHVIEPLAPEGSPVATYKITYPPRDAAPPPRVHEGYEWLYVLTGRLRLSLDSRELILTRGEAAEFDTRIPHSISAASGRPAEVISIFNEDGVQLHTHTSGEGR